MASPEQQFETALLSALAQREARLAQPRFFGYQYANPDSESAINQELFEPLRQEYPQFLGTPAPTQAPKVLNVGGRAVRVNPDGSVEEVYAPPAEEKAPKTVQDDEGNIWQWDGAAKDWKPLRPQAAEAAAVPISAPRGWTIQPEVSETVTAPQATGRPPWSGKTFWKPSAEATASWEAQFGSVPGRGGEPSMAAAPTIDAQALFNAAPPILTQAPMPTMPGAVSAGMTVPVPGGNEQPVPLSEMRPDETSFGGLPVSSGWFFSRAFPKGSTAYEGGKARRIEYLQNLLARGRLTDQQYERTKRELGELLPAPGGNEPTIPLASFR